VAINQARSGTLAGRRSVGAASVHGLRPKARCARLKSAESWEDLPRGRAGAERGAVARAVGGRGRLRGNRSEQSIADGWPVVARDVGWPCGRRSLRERGRRRCVRFRVVIEKVGRAARRARREGHRGAPTRYAPQSRSVVSSGAANSGATGERMASRQAERCRVIGGQLAAASGGVRRARGLERPRRRDKGGRHCGRPDREPDEGSRSGGGEASSAQRGRGPSLE